MEAIASKLRSRVGQLAAEVGAGTLSQQDALELLRNEALKHSSNTEVDADHSRAVLHACPWHTCQGTLHAPAA